MGLEINLLRIIPLILSKLNFYSTESRIKYFLPQAIASLILIFASILNFEAAEFLFLNFKEILISFALFIKSGSAPLHFWFPQVTINCEWIQCFILFTWQKVAPLFLLRRLSANILVAGAIFSALVGILGGLNQNNVKILLTYSSISHLGWILLASIFNSSSWILYFCVYRIISASVIFFLAKTGVSVKIRDMSFWKIQLKHKYIFVLRFLSLGGIPPLTGFFAKLLIIILVINFKIRITFMFLIFSSLVSIYFYCRIIYSSFLTPSFRAKLWRKNVKIIFYIWIIISISFNFILPWLIIFL